jgi:hypothetical protein
MHHAASIIIIIIPSVTITFPRTQNLSPPLATPPQTPYVPAVLELLLGSPSSGCAASVVVFVFDDDEAATRNCRYCAGMWSSMVLLL